MFTTKSPMACVARNIDRSIRVIESLCFIEVSLLYFGWYKSFARRN